MFNAPRYFLDRCIDFRQDSGWANIPCPLCRSQVYGTNPSKPYLGFNLKNGYFHCWRCGPHSVQDVIMALEGIEYHVACGIANEYEADFEYRPPPDQPKQARGLEGTLDWPGGTIPLQDYHRQYLINRGFDPDHLAARYGIMGTVNAGEYGGMIMVPIMWWGKMVSYQGRTIHRGVEPRYKACHKDRELIAHEEIIYDLDNARGDTLLVVEGVFDAWRLGDGAVATFGTSMNRSSPQVMLLVQWALAVNEYQRTGKRTVFVIFDVEPAAQRKARWLRDQLSALGVEAMNVVLDRGDPGAMAQAEADEMKRRLLE